MRGNFSSKPQKSNFSTNFRRTNNQFDFSSTKENLFKNLKFNTEKKDKLISSSGKRSKMAEKLKKVEKGKKLQNYQTTEPKSIW